MPPILLAADKTYAKGLMWFRRDLRVDDNAALYHALRACRQLLCVFVFDRAILDALPRADRRVEFIRESLAGLDARLRELAGQEHAGLVTCHAAAVQEIPRLARELGVQAVFANHDYEAQAVARDAAVRGALGLVINKPSDINLAVLFEKIELRLARPELGSAPVFQGGPVQTERGFVLHEPVFREGEKPNESVYASTMTIPGGLEMTTSKDVLEALATGAGPRKVLVSLGYAAWGEGQLESELAENSWLTVGADPAVIFDTPVEQRYDLSLIHI